MKKATVYFSLFLICVSVYANNDIVINSPKLLLHDIVSVPKANVQNQIVIKGVPPYLWDCGCGATTIAMLLGYYDGLGYDIIPGNSTQKTTDVNLAIATKEHCLDYVHPVDYKDIDPFPLPDKSELPLGDEHKDDSIADFLGTSRSINGLYYGWSFWSKTDDAIMDYIKYLKKPFYFESKTVKVSWDTFKNEINSNKPVILLVSTVDKPNHLVIAFGYTETPKRYACYTTYTEDIEWFDWVEKRNEAFSVWAMCISELKQHNAFIPIVTR